MNRRMINCLTLSLSLSLSIFVQGFAPSNTAHIMDQMDTDLFQKDIDQLFGFLFHLQNTTVDYVQVRLHKIHLELGDKSSETCELEHVYTPAAVKSWRVSPRVILQWFNTRLSFVKLDIPCFKFFITQLKQSVCQWWDPRIPSIIVNVSVISNLLDVLSEFTTAVVLQLTNPFTDC